MFVKCEKNNTDNFTFFIRDRIFINCVDDDNLLIDMNDAKIPNKINKNIKKDQTFCPKNEFLVYTPGDPKKMGISHAFDNKVDETSFFETGIDEKPSIIIEFNNPVNYFTYEFFMIYHFYEEMFNVKSNFIRIQNNLHQVLADPRRRRRGASH